jgi:signal transduction histidine kinase/PAS domain-containing protein
MKNFNIYELENKSKEELIQIILQQSEGYTSSESSVNKLNQNNNEFNKSDFSKTIIENKEYLLNLINLVEDIICIKDDKGSWLLASSSILKMFALENIDYVGKTDLELSELTDPIFKETFKTSQITDEDAWQKRTTLQNDELIPSIDGKVKIYNVMKQPTFNSDGTRKSLIVVGRDVTTERKVLELERFLHNQNRILKDIAIALLELDSADAIYDYITKVIAEITHSSLVISTAYQENSNVLEMKAVHPSKMIDFVKRQFPAILDKIKIEIDDDYRRHTVSIYKNIYKLNFDLYELTFHQMPKYFTDFFNRYSKFETSYTLGYIFEDEIFGYLSIMLKNNEDISDKEFLETVVYLASISIKRLQIYGELIKSKNELELSNLSKEKFFSILARDVEKPFNNIFRQTYYLTENYNKIPLKELNSKLFEYKVSLTEANYLLENIFEWSKLEMNLINIERQIYPITHFYDIDEKFILKNSSEKEIKVINELNPNHKVFADERLTEIIFRNIFYNSIKFTKKGGTIILRSNEIGNFIEVSIIDNGRGIPESILPKLFLKEYKFSTLGTAGEEGTGLGLLVAKSFVNLQNGQIEITSKFHYGTTVKFTLPKGSI